MPPNLLVRSRAVQAALERGFAEVPGGVLHYAACGAGEPVLLLHQTPRSWDEYRDVLPLLGRRRRAVAMDTLGFGDSRPAREGEHSVERWAAAAAALLDVLGLGRVAVVGHHTGAYVAVELAVAFPDTVRAVVLSSLGLTDPEERRRQATGRAPVDEVVRAEDGSHVLELWRLRAPFYPPGRPDLLERFLVDALRAGALAAEGHRVVARYAVEERLRLVRCPVLLVAATADRHAYPSLPALRAALPGAAVAEIEHGMVPLPDGRPEEFAAAVEEFLDRLAAVEVRPPA
jgi:pimeloyl-ACP methyl ester carboxylesterase